jgi:hypothetical protein
VVRAWCRGWRWLAAAASVLVIIMETCMYF